MTMSIQQSESVKYFFDHVKSVWTLSAGGLAASVALLGYIVKESRVADALNILFGLGCVIAVLLFTYSIWKGLTAQVDLIQEVSDAEAAEDPASEISETLVRGYKKGKLLFFLGCVAIIITALAFSVLNSLAGRGEANGMDVSIKNVTFTLPDSKKVEIENLTLRLPDSVGTLAPGQTIEIEDLTFKVRMVSSR